MFLLPFPSHNASLQVTNFAVSNNCNVNNLDECIALCGDGSFANYECTPEGTICTCSDECLEYEHSKTNTQVWAIDPVRSYKKCYRKIGGIYMYVIFNHKSHIIIAFPMLRKYYHITSHWHPVQARCPGTLPSLEIKAPKTASSGKTVSLSLVFTPAADYIYAAANRGSAGSAPVGYPTTKTQSKKVLSEWTLSLTIPNGAKIVSANSASKSKSTPVVAGTTVTWEDVQLTEGGTTKVTPVVLKVQVDMGTANPAKFEAYATSNEGGYTVFALPCPTTQVSRSRT
jgi:hypothetical protein